MRIIDRFTRDRVSRYVWAVLTVGCLLGVVLAGYVARQRQTTALRDQVSAAQVQTRHIADTVLFTNLSHDAMTKGVPSPLYRDIYVALQSQVFTDTAIARVRVWTPDGILQYSTHERDQVGLLQTQDKTLIDQAMKGQSVYQKVLTKFTAASTGTDQTPTNLLEVFVPLHVPDWIAVSGVVEVDYYYDTFVQAAHQSSATVVEVLLGLAAICLLMMLLSFRAPLKTLGAGVTPDGGTAEPRRGGKHAANPPAEKVTRAVQRQAEQAIAKATNAEAEAANLREQLSGSRDQHKEPEEARGILEAKVKQIEADLAAAAAAATAGVAGGVTGGDVHSSRLIELENDIAQAVERAHSAEERMREAEARASLADDKALEAASRARSAEDAAAAASAESDRIRAALEAKPKEASAKSKKTQAVPAAVDDVVLVKLEERIAAAERRASDAEARLLRLQAVRPAPRDEPPEDAVTATTGDLRSRLARTAARKKLGADDGTAATAAAAEAEATRSAGNPDRPSGDTVDPTPDP